MSEWRRFKLINSKNEKKLGALLNKKGITKV